MPYINSRMKDVIERVAFLREAKSQFHSNQSHSYLLYGNNL